ncbi:MAG: hypothetical protein WDZ80_03310 [Candidatus Paceibacterota bacterium]
MKHENYRTLSEGLISVFGNSAEVKETFFATSRDQDAKLIRELVETAHNNLEERIENHILTFGQDFDKYDLPYPQKKEKPLPPKRKRGDITAFTRASRYRLLKKLNKLNPDSKAQFYHVTLTYPKQFPTDGKTHKADLDAFIKRCKRKFGNEIEYLWKLEFQKRGAPHYHIIIFMPKSYKIQYLREWFSKNWYEVAQRLWETKLENHKNVGVSVEKINSLKQAGFYLSKYIAKDEGETPENHGRYWGCSRNWGETVLREVKLTGRQLIQFRRLTKRFLKGQPRMQKMITQPMNLVVFGHWGFFTMAIEWVKKTY